MHPHEPPDCSLDPRIERSRRLVLQATFELLTEVGYGGVTVEAVAARSGVAKSTIYRHWSGKPALIEAAIRANKPASIVAAPCSTFRERVIAHMQGVATFAASSQWAACMPALLEAAQRDGEVAQMLDNISTTQRGHMIELLRCGQERGDLPADADLGLVVDSLVGPIFVRRLFNQRGFTPDEVVRLVDQVLPAAAAVASAAAAAPPTLP